LGKTDSIQADFEAGKFDALMVGIGYNHMKVRKAVFERFKGSIPFANIIHSSCYVDSSVKLGEGIFLLPGTVIDMEAEVGDNVLMNTQVTVAHHTKIGSHSFLAPGVHLAGLIHVGECSFVGIGCTVIDCINIAPWSVIGAGAVVINDTEPYSVSVGTPSRIIKYKEQ
jgi:sugar O-acyltransferase (sialic acid O-acetyltransferase NeuD family)